MPEIVGTFLRTELRDERADRSVKAWNGSRCHLAQECLEFAVRHLDGIEVRRIFRQVAQCRSRFLDSPANARSQMDPAVIHHDDVVAPEHRNQAVFDIGEEHLSGHGTLDHHWGNHFIVAQISHLPSGTEPITRTPRGARPLSLAMFVLTAVSSMNTRRAGSSIPCSRIHRRRARATSARCRSTACRAFFESDVVSVEKTPKRAAAGFDPSLAQFCSRFYQGQVRLLGNQIQNLGRELFQRRDAPAARLRGGGPLFTPALQPLYYRRHADLETFRRLASRRAGLHSCDNARPQVTRIGLRYPSPPKGESMRKDLLIPSPMGIPPIQISREPL